MNKERIETLAAAWTVETVDLSARVSAAIGAATTNAAAPAADMAELLTELKEMRKELSDFQRTALALQEELFRLRFEIKEGSQRRIEPYASAERYATGW